MLYHSVVFSLKPSVDKQAEQAFFEAAKKLATIEGVDNFKWLRQVSPKNDFHFGIAMNFADEAVYRRYNDHPLHAQFIADHWLPCVNDFMEIDYLPYE